ncbi:hypothetical protein M3Y94_00431700 [Aphelenchoides besseyi]|nr:hypothetical protein M3Y94_00431700 [Aphelenchoides besseyi]
MQEMRGVFASLLLFVFASATPEEPSLTFEALYNCRQDKFTVERPALRNNLIYQEFLNRRPYHYMQLCYWKESYIRGVEDYMAGRWKSCTTEFKKGLDHFFRDLNVCRHLCEDVLDWSSLEGDNPEISVVITSAYASVLRCKSECAKKLSIINGRYVTNFLASFFEYTHIFNHGAFASQAVANALLLDSENIVMRRNKLFYLDKYQRADLFEPSEVKLILHHQQTTLYLKDIIRFYKREILEKRFIDFIDERFRFFNGESVGFSRLLIDELHQRIGQRYGRLPNLQGTFCALEGQKLQSECERGALIVSIDEQRCGAILSEDFDGCAVVFCV